MHRFFQRLFFEYRYLSRPRWDTGISPPELLAYIRDNPPGTVLDVGCGTGTNLLTLARAGWQVSGIDLSHLAILKARRRFHRAGYSAYLKAADFTCGRVLPGSFDLILDIGCFHSLEPGRRPEYVNRVVAGLKEGGALLLYAHYRRESSPQGHGITQEDVDKIQATPAS